MANRSPRQPARQKPRPGWTKYVIGTVAGLVGAMALFTAGFFALVELYPFDASKLTASRQPTVVYDRNGQVYMTLSGQGATDVTYDQLPSNLVNAVVATEDHNFWNSSSVDVRGLLRAAFVDLWTQSLAQGGSTIQEQLAKIVYLNDKKTLSRKLNQIVLGVQINRHFTKQEIMAMYLNRVFLGENSVGVEQAAERYFGVDLKKGQTLTLPQAALLAGLLQAPSAYDPLQHPDAALKRRNQVIENMVKYGYLTRAQADAAEKQPLGASYHKLPGDAWDNHPLFTNFLLDFAEQAGIPQEELLQGGLKVYTTVDPKVQGAIDQVFWSGNYNGDFPGPTTGTVVQGAAVFVDPKTGGILGAAGSRQQGYAVMGLDRAIHTQRSPGSSIKPLLVYGPAIESGQWGPDSVLDNEPHDFGGGYIPRNDDPNAPAKVSLRYALATSQNVAAVWLLQQIGINTGADFAANAGIPITSNDRKHLGIALGGLEQGVSPLMMAQAYAAFANQGVEEQAHLITKVVNAAGDTLYNYQPAAKRIMSANTAAVMTDLLQSVVQEGTGTAARVPGWGVAGKTGTVQYDASQTGPHRDWISTAWFDGYTPTLAGSIYIGYDQPDANHHMIDIPHTPSYNCAKIFGDIVRLAVAGQPPQTFAPSGPAQTTTARAVYGLAATWDPVAQAVQLTWQTDMSGTVAFQIRRSSTPLPGVSGGAAGGPGPGTGGAGPGGNGTAGTTGLAGGGTGAAGTGTPSGGIAGTGAALPGQAGTGANTAGGPGVGTGTTGAGASGTAAAGATSQVLGLTTQPSYTDAEVLPGYAYTYVVQAVNLQTQQPVGQPQSITVNVVAPGMVSSGGTGAGTAAGGAGTAGGGPGAGGTTPVPNPGSTGPGTPGNLAGTGQSGTGGSVGSGWGGAPGGTSGSQGGTNTAAGAPGAPAGPGEPWAPGGTAGTSGGTGTGTAPAGQTAESTTGMRSLPHSHRRP